MTTALGVDFVGLWDEVLWAVTMVGWCGVLGVSARKLIVYDLEWALGADIGKDWQPTFGWTQAQVV